jgi:hypothetical protein
MVKKQLYIGQFWCNQNEIEKLKSLGVRGPMIWRPDNNNLTKKLGKDGIIERCICDEEALQNLEKEYEEMWRTKYPLCETLFNKPESVAYPRNCFYPITAERANKEMKYDLPTNLLADILNDLVELCKKYQIEMYSSYGDGIAIMKSRDGKSYNVNDELTIIETISPKGVGGSY